MLDFRMNTFLVLCDEMNYRITAEKLNMTQPSVTQHIKFLERHYGCRFFEYDGKKLTKTLKAEILEQYARSEKHNTLRLEEQLQLVKKQKLRIGATKTIGDYMLDECIFKLINDSRYELTVIVNNTVTLLDKLNHQELDLLLIEGVFDKVCYGYELFRKEAFLGVCHKEHPFAGREVSMTDIIEEHLIIREPGSGTRHIFEQILQTKSYDLNHFQKITCLSSLKLIETMIMKGQGISFAYESFVNNNDKLTTFRIRETDCIREINFVYLNNTDVSDWIALLK